MLLVFFSNRKPKKFIIQENSFSDLLRTTIRTPVVERVSFFTGWSLKISINFGWHGGSDTSLLTSGRCSEVVVNTGLTVGQLAVKLV
jgi:hypothetical protein